MYSQRDTNILHPQELQMDQFNKLEQTIKDYKAYQKETSGGNKKYKPEFIYQVQKNFLDKALKKSEKVQVKFVNDSIINMIFNNPEGVAENIIKSLGSEAMISDSESDNNNLFLTQVAEPDSEDFL
jgi:ribosomal protein S25